MGMAASQQKLFQKDRQWAKFGPCIILCQLLLQSSGFQVALPRQATLPQHLSKMCQYTFEPHTPNLLNQKHQASPHFCASTVDSSEKILIKRIRTIVEYLLCIRSFRYFFLLFFTTVLSISYIPCFTTGVLKRDLNQWQPNSTIYLANIVQNNLGDQSITPADFPVKVIRNQLNQIDSSLLISLLFSIQESFLCTMPEL